MSAEAIAKRLLRKHEGFRGDPYVDTEGHATIGYGTKLPLVEPEADLLLAYRMDPLLPELPKLIPSWATLGEVRQAVLIDMAYNLGIPRLSTFVKTLDAIAMRDFNRAADQMLDSRWAVQVGKSEGQRAHRLAQMMRTGKDAQE